MNRVGQDNSERIVGFPLVSVIVPVYNMERYLHQCLDSLLTQTLSNIEIICVDDCSTDSSLAILHEYENRDSRIKVVTSVENGKQGTAKNQGIRLSQAEYIGFVDSDDWVSGTMYAELYAEVMENGADIAVGDYVEYRGEGNIKTVRTSGKRVLYPKDRNDGMEILHGSSMRLVASLFKKSLFLENQLYFSENLFYEDNAIAQALYLSAGKIAKTGLPCYFYRCDNMSTTRSMNNYRFFDRMETSKQYLQNMKRLGFYDRYQKECDACFFYLFYEATIMGALFHFDPPEKRYIDKVKAEMSTCVPDFSRNQYIYMLKKASSLSHGIILCLIGLNTDFGIWVCTHARRWKHFVSGGWKHFGHHA